MSRRLAAAGVDCTLQIWDGQIHAFPVLAGLLPEAMAALIEAGAFIQEATARPRRAVTGLTGTQDMEATA
jgi:acetyl esterase/lipase